MMIEKSIFSAVYVFAIVFAHSRIDFSVDGVDVLSSLRKRFK